MMKETGKEIDNLLSEFEVREITSYPDPTKGPKRFLIIEYKIIKKEINRYYYTEGDKK